MFTAIRQFASANELKEINVSLPLPGNSEIAPDGTVVYPATAWCEGTILELEKYYVSLDACVWSKKQGSLKLVSIRKDGQVGVYVGSARRQLKVHRIVASTFLLGARHTGQTEVDHIVLEELSSRNAATNLRWATSTQNKSNRCPIKAKVSAKRVGDLYSKPVQQLCPASHSVIAEFPSATAAAEATNISRWTISNAINKKRKTSDGSVWQLAPREMTLENFKNRGPEYIGGALAEAPHLYFSNDLQVYNDSIGKMYQIPVNHGQVYPTINIGGSLRYVHVVVAVMRSGKFASLAAYGEHCATQLREFGMTVVVRHDQGVPKTDFWNVSIGTASENGFDIVREKSNTGKSAAQPVEIRVGTSRDTASVAESIVGGASEAKFASFSDAARALGKYSELKNLVAGICVSARTGCSFSLLNGQKAWAFVL